MTYIADIHIHAHDLIPQPFRLLYKFLNRKTMPPIFNLQQFPQSDLSFVVVNAVGDKLVTGLYGFNTYNAVKKQLKKIRRQTEKLNAILYSNSESIQEALEENRPLIMLAVEGGDFLNNRRERIKEIFKLGVRALTIVHSADNCIGYSTLSLAELFKSQGNLPSKKYGGLSEFGKRAIEELNELGLLIDLAHSCEETANDAINHSTRPVIASHTGAATVQSNFPRFISDDLIQKIADGGGIIGLWPFYLQPYGVKTRADLLQHTQHIKSLVGSSHLAIGTDINGLPGIMENFCYPTDLSSLVEDFKSINFTEAEATDILGKNFTTFLSNNKF
ncbi:MAG: dipeptidase [Promethearchaeota archaeon]